MSLQKKLGFGALIGFLAAVPSLAQSFGVGASVGLVNDVTQKFHIDQFNRRDLNGWVEYEMEEKLVLRATLGSLNMKGANAGQVVTPPFATNPVTLPDLMNRVRYGMVSISYELVEKGLTSGLFAGVGGYTIRPESVDPEIANYRDARETAFGWHAGVDGGVRLFSRLNLLVRITYHNIRSSSGRSLLTANGGLSYRF